MTIDRRLIAGALGLAIGLAACGAVPASPAASSVATTAPTTTPATAAPASEAPTASAAEPSDEGINLPGGMNDLAGLLPEEAGGVAYQRAGYNGDQLGVYGAAAGLSDQELAPLLNQFGKSINDVNFAIAQPTGGSTATIMALQIEGVDATQWMEAVNIDPADYEAKTIGGKTVLAQGAGGFNVYAYPRGDTVFLLILGDDALAEAVFSQLP